MSLSETGCSNKAFPSTRTQKKQLTDQDFNTEAKAHHKSMMGSYRACVSGDRTECRCWEGFEVSEQQ